MNAEQYLKETIANLHMQTAMLVQELDTLKKENESLKEQIKNKLAEEVKTDA